MNPLITKTKNNIETVIDEPESIEDRLRVLILLISSIHLSFPIQHMDKL